MKITIVDEGTEREQIIISAAGCTNTYFWLDAGGMCWRRESNGSGRQITVFDLCTYYPEVRDRVIQRTKDAIRAARGVDAQEAATRKLVVELFVAERS